MRPCAGCARNSTETRTMKNLNGVGSGTGANYPIILGAFQCMMDEGAVFDSWTGVSGSAMDMSMLASGWEPKEALKIAKETLPIDIIRPSLVWPVVPGLFTLDKMQEALQPNVALTFGDTETPLTIIATDSDTEEEIQFSSQKTPDVKLAPATQASTSIPWMFHHVEIDGRRLTDGGIVHNFPVDLPKSHAVGVRVLGQKHDPKPWKWWGSYSLNHVDAMMRAGERSHVSRAIWQKAKIVVIESPISGLDFLKLDKSMVNRLYTVGYEAVEKKLKNGWTWEPPEPGNGERR